MRAEWISDFQPLATVECIVLGVETEYLAGEADFTHGPKDKEIYCFRIWKVLSYWPGTVSPVCFMSDLLMRKSDPA